MGLRKWIRSRFGKLTPEPSQELEGGPSSTAGRKHAYPVASQRYQRLWSEIYSIGRVWGSLAACHTRLKSRVIKWRYGAEASLLSLLLSWSGVIT